MVISVFGCSSVPNGHPTQPDIILVSIDTLRADHLSCYGYSRQTTPFIDSLAAQGILYENARSPSPWTLPTHTTMMTGQYPFRHGVVDDMLRRDPKTQVLAQVMREKGYATGGFVSSLYVSSVFDFDDGFDHFEDFSLHTERVNLAGVVSADQVIAKALQWFQERPAGKPVFLFLHFYDAHYAYEPPAPYNTMFDRASQKGDLRYKNYFYFRKHTPNAKQFHHLIAQYDESIRFVDDQLRRLSRALSDRSIRWVITSDHGEEFGERGSWGHAHTLFSEQLHVPLIISGDGIPTRKEAQFVGTHDIPITISSWVKAADQFQADGIDIMDFPIPKRGLIGESSRFQTCRLSFLKEGYRFDWDVRGKKHLLFSDKDAQEQEDLSIQHPEKILAMQEELLQTMGPSWKAQEAGNAQALYIFPFRKAGSYQELEVAADELFLTLPFDEEVVWTAKEKKRFSQQNRPTNSDTLLYIRGDSVTFQPLDAQMEKMLEELGYMQKER